jgi:hypothetical protein
LVQRGDTAAGLAYLERASHLAPDETVLADFVAELRGNR